MREGGNGKGELILAGFVPGEERRPRRNRTNMGTIIRGGDAEVGQRKAVEEGAEELKKDRQERIGRRGGWWW